jgi:hypothetical protein
VEFLIGIPDEQRNLTTQYVVLPEEMAGWDIVHQGDVIVALEYFKLDNLRSAHPFNKKCFRGILFKSRGDPVCG